METDNLNTGLEEGEHGKTSTPPMFALFEAEIQV
jgi:hypothetical protein